MDNQAIEGARALPLEAAASGPAAAPEATGSAASDAPESFAEAAETVAVVTPAAKVKKPRQRRGPPPAGVEEKRVDMILTTSRLSDARGGRLRRGQVVSVPERRLAQLTLSGKVRKASASELETAIRRHGPAGRIG